MIPRICMLALALPLTITAFSTTAAEAAHCTHENFTIIQRGNDFYPVQTYFCATDHYGRGYYEYFRFMERGAAYPRAFPDAGSAERALRQWLEAARRSYLKAQAVPRSPDRDPRYEYPQYDNPRPEGRDPGANGHAADDRAYPVAGRNTAQDKTAVASSPATADEWNGSRGDMFGASLAEFAFFSITLWPPLRALKIGSRLIGAAPEMRSLSSARRYAHTDRLREWGGSDD